MAAIAIFVLVKFSGYCMFANWRFGILPGWRNPALFGITRLLLGWVGGVLVFGLGVRYVPFLENGSFYLLLIGLRFVEWVAALSLFYGYQIPSLKKGLQEAALGMGLSCLLDVPPALIAVSVPGLLPLC